MKILILLVGEFFLMLFCNNTSVWASAEPLRCSQSQVSLFGWKDVFLGGQTDQKYYPNLFDTIVLRKTAASGGGSATQEFEILGPAFSVFSNLSSVQMTCPSDELTIIASRIEAKDYAASMLDGGVWVRPVLTISITGGQRIRFKSLWNVYGQDGTRIDSGHYPTVFSQELSLNP